MQIAEARKKLLQNKEFEKEYQKRSLSWEIAKMIVRARLMKNMTQSKLAELVNTQQPSIARIESGERLPSLAILEKIAEAMGSYLIPPKIAFLDNSFTLTTNSSTKDFLAKKEISNASHLGETYTVSTKDYSFHIEQGRLNAKPYLVSAMC